MTLDVLVRLRDQLSGGLNKIVGMFRRLGSMARTIGLLGASVAAISFMGPIREAAAFQQKLLDIAGTAELSGKASFDFADKAKTQYEALALASAQASQTIAAGAGQMIAAGLDQKLVDASIGNIAMATAAANAEFSDMAGLSTSLLQNLRLPANQLKDSLGALVISGKLGAFELKDMAKYFPSLTGQMAKFGVTGREAVNFLGAALQIAKMGTSDPAEAANNLRNFLLKVMSPATVKNFKDMGVNIEQLMQDAATQGLDPLEAVLQKITTLTKASGVDIAAMMAKAKASGLQGADALAAVRSQLEKIHAAGALGNLFADQQVMDFLIPYMANVDKFKQIKDEVAKATGAVIDRDSATQLAGLNDQLKIFEEIGTQASREVGFAFGAWLPVINSNLEAALKWFREWNAQTGGLGTRLLTLAGGGILAATALGALGIALPVIGAGFSLVLALASPLGAAIAIIAFAAWHIYKNWALYGPRLKRLWDGAKTSFEQFMNGHSPQFIRGLAAGIAALAGLFFPKAFALFVLQDLMKWFEGKASVIGDVSKALSRLTGIDANKIGKVLSIVAGAGAGLLLFGGPLMGLGRNIASIAGGLGLLGGANAAAGLGTLETLGGLSIAGGLSALALSAAAAAGSIKLLYDAMKQDPKLTNAIGSTMFNTWYDRVADLFRAGPNSPETVFANDNPNLGPGNKGTPMPAKQRAKEQATFNRPEVVDWKLLQAKKETEEALKAGKLNTGSWWEKTKSDLDAISKVGTALKAPQIKRGSTDTLPGKTKDDLGVTRGVAPAQVKVGGTIVIKVDGLGKVTSAVSTNSNVKLETGSTGRVVGRV